MVKIIKLVQYEEKNNILLIFEQRNSISFNAVFIDEI